MSDKIEKLIEERDEALDKAEALLDKSIEEKRDFTEEEEAEYKSLSETADRIEKQVERLEKSSSLRAKSHAPTSKAIIESPKNSVEVTEDEKDKGPLWRNAGEFYKAVINASNPNTRNVDERLFRPGKMNQEKRAALGLQEAVNADGGFLVDQPLADELIRKVFDDSVLASSCRQIEIGPRANGIKIPAMDDDLRTSGNRLGGVTATWTAEAAQYTASNPTFRQITLDLNKLTSLIYITDEMLQDTSAMESIISESMISEMRYEIDEAIYDGDGTGKPLGLLQSGARVTVAKEAAQVADTIVYENVVKMESRLWQRSRSSAVWYANINILPQLLLMEFPGDNSPVYLPAGGASGRPFDTLMGRRIVFIEQAKTLGDEGDLMLSDNSSYLLARKGGITSATSMHLRFDFGEMAFRAQVRVDGTHSWDTALTPANGTETQSPVVTLAERA